MGRDRQVSTGRAEAVRTYRLEGLITLLAPLSHIGESIGPDSYLAETTVIGPDGCPVRCFAYSGNAFRGQLRDLGARYLLDAIGSPAVNIDAFYLLFSGGSIGGEHSLDIDQARMYRKLLPHLSIFGGGVGNQIMPGKIHIGPMWPLVAETQRILPAHLRDSEAPSFGQWTSEHSFTRTDDEKNEDLRRYIDPSSPPRALRAGKQERLAIKGDAEAGPVKEDRGKPQQMRYTVEVLSAGSRLYQRVDLADVTELELGAFVACLHEFAEAPYIGGMSRVGFGLVEAEWTYTVAGEDLDPRPFVTVGQDRRCLMAPVAEAAKESYDAHLREVYTAYLEGHAPEIRLALGVGEAADASA